MSSCLAVGHYDEVWRRKGNYSGENLIRPGTRLDLASQLLGTGERLLDVGCGSGALGRLATGRFRLLAGVEFSPVAAFAARTGGTCVILADVDRSPFPVHDACVDAVACLDVIEHVRDPRLLMCEIARVLRPGGRAILTSPNIQFWRHIWSLVRGRFPRTSTDPEGYDGGHLHYFTFRDLEALGEAVGLEVIHRQGIINAPRYGRKNRLLKVLLGERFVREFRTFGILLILRRPVPGGGGG